MTRLLFTLTLALAGTIDCRQRAESLASRAPDRSGPEAAGGHAQEPAACVQPTRLVDPARASATWVVQAAGSPAVAEPSRLTGQYYSSGGLHIVVLDTLGADGCWRTADSVATPATSPAEFLSNACGPAPDATDRRWIGVVPDTTAQAPRVLWRVQVGPPRIVPAAADSVRCWRKFTG